MKKKLFATVLAATAVLGLTSCATDSAADVVSYNLSEAAKNFEVARRIQFINNETAKSELEIVGRCNIEAEPAQLEVTCRDASGDKKHFLGINGSHYVVEQLDPKSVSADHYRVTYAPSTLIPDVSVR
ncbi:hypothetical protein CJ179_38675 [Rhodococcus sp. ACS1]|uniref:beta-sandwich lipoprotein n=1 Tax=Rhodococcus sp. ACS1 TaxID=2028570 RepID=UPI000BB1162C|nr:hypothetical protein [Rhodococcus sp. ACS1]PBC38526.1 hypothetical protein CJ179_38675 [Rhodococcus sp. ACS1]